jgi:hypothetical protein
MKSDAPNLARVRDRELRDLVEDLQDAVDMLTTSERRARNRTHQARLVVATASVSTAIRYLDELRQAVIP